MRDQSKRPPTAAGKPDPLRATQRQTATAAAQQPLQANTSSTECPPSKNDMVAKKAAGTQPNIRREPDSTLQANYIHCQFLLAEKTEEVRLKNEELTALRGIVNSQRAEIDKLKAQIDARSLSPNLSLTPQTPSQPRIPDTMPTTLSLTPVDHAVRAFHPAIPIPDLDPQFCRKLKALSRGRPDRYGCLVFCATVSPATLREWETVTNWDGSRGKSGLPQNLRDFIMESVRQEYPTFAGRGDLKRLKDRINEYLRSPRSYPCGFFCG